MPSPQPETERSTGSLLVVIGGAAIALGSFLPWITASTAFGTVSRNGLDGGGDGMITLGGGVLLAVLGITHINGLGRANGIGTLVVSGLLAIVAFLNYQEITDRVASVGSQYLVGSVGAGIWTIFVGVFVAGIGSLKSVSSVATTAATESGPNDEPPPPSLGAAR